MGMILRRSRRSLLGHGERKVLMAPPGFSLVELVVVIALIMVLLSIAAPQVLNYIEQSRKASCLANRHHMEQDERVYHLEHSMPSLAIEDRYRCPSGGTYVWLISDPGTPGYPRLGCSLHFGDATVPLTSLGSSFTEITTAMINLITSFRDENNRYPRSWGTFVFSDLGLDPAEWGLPVNGLYYTPGGRDVKVQPAEGYRLTVTSVQGETLSLTSNLNWNLFYDVPDGLWYYHSKAPKNVVDINTLQVRQR